jgi:hypothetical protein
LAWAGKADLQHGEGKCRNSNLLGEILKRRQKEGETPRGEEERFCSGRREFGKCDVTGWREGPNMGVEKKEGFPERGRRRQADFFLHS